MADEPREQFVLDLIDDGWPASDPFGLRPDISYGWFDEDKDVPQVTIPFPDEGPIDGGDTGYTAMTPTGTPVQTIGGTIDIHLWCAFDELDSASTSNPREYISGSASRSDGSITTGMIGEVYRIAEDNAHHPQNPKTGNRLLATLAHGQASPVPEPDRRGLYHYVVPYVFNWNTD